MAGKQIEIHVLGEAEPKEMKGKTTQYPRRLSLNKRCAFAISQRWPKLHICVA